MKVFRILSRNIRDAFKSVFRNFSLSMASIIAITITLLVVSFSVIVTYSVNNFAEEVKSDVTIVVFLNSEIANEQVTVIEEQIKAIGNVSDYTFNSKFDITKDFIESSEIYKNIMSNWDDATNPLQHTFLVKVKNLEEIKATADEISEFDGVTAVKYGEGMVEGLITLMSGIRTISMLIVLSLLLVTIFLIINTIKITIYARFTEIEIMRLVGASNINIRLPFLFEGFFIGLIGAIPPVAITIYAYTYLFERFSGKIALYIVKLVQPFPFLYYLSLILLIIGALVGMFGSWRASKKYLKI